MDQIIANVGYFLELWMILVYAGMIWKKNISFKGFSIILYIINGIILTGINLNIFPKFSVIVVYVALAVYVHILFGKSIKEDFVKFCMVIACAWGTEIVAGTIVVLLFVNKVDESILLILINGVACLLTYFTLFVVKKINGHKVIEIKYDTVVKVILLCIVPIVLTWIDYCFYHSIVIWCDVLLVLYFVILLWYLSRLQKSKNQIEQQKIALNVNKTYGRMYEDIITDIRRRQHEYKNQIAAIYSSHRVAKSMDDLVMIQEKYCDKLQENKDYEYILLLCGEPVLAGFLYYKCLVFREHNVMVDCNVSLNHWSGKVMLHEVIEILGILLDNAYEKELENDYSDKKIQLKVQEFEDKIYISVLNRIDSECNIQLQRMFEPGYSTKGDNRGFGLSRVKQLCDKYELDVQIAFNKVKHNTISFSITIEK